MSANNEIVIIDGARTGIGTFGGQYSSVPAATLGATVVKALLERNNLEGTQVDGVIMGCVGQIGKDAYLARAVGINSGLPVEVPALTLNRLCGSGLQAVNSAASEIIAGNAAMIIAGGAENMTLYPYLVEKARFGARMGDTPLADALTTVLSDPFTSCHMGITAENVSETFNINREESDEFALRSQRLASTAVEQERFASQIVPVIITQKKGDSLAVTADEHIRPQTTLEGLAKLKPAFKNTGIVTAGNSSGINDGAGALIVTSAAKAQELGLKPRLRLVSQAVAGVPPEIMGIGPVPAVHKVLAKAGMKIEQIDLFELNEAFAAQALACIQQLGIDPEKVNVNGGAVAMGHPIGATGAILTVKIMHEMERRNLWFGIVTACIGGGQGIATIFENLSV